MPPFTPREDRTAILMAAAEIEAHGNVHTAGAMRRTVERELELEATLRHLREHAGDCLADNPRWLAKIDALLGPKTEELA